MSRFTLPRAVACVFPLLMVGCAQHSQVPGSPDPIRISYSVGPCYGTCPVYQVAVEADGSTYFNGERHTLVAGTQERKNRARVFRQVRSTLADYQPAMGVTQGTEDCTPRVTDLPQYTVIWTNASYEQAVLEHNTGCHSDRGRELTQTLRSLDGLLGVDAWVRTPIP